MFAVFLAGAFAFLDLYCTQPLLPLLSRVFHASEASVGVTISAPTLGVACSALLLALFGERLDRKRLIIASMTALGIVAALTATATSLFTLEVWRLLQGFITPGIFIITIAYVTEEWPPQLVPRVMSVYVAGTIFGGFVGRVTGGILASHYGWRSMFFVLGIAGLIGAFVNSRFMRPGSHRPPKHPHESRFAPFLANVQNPRLLATFAIGFCMLFTLIAVFNYVTFHLTARPFHLSTPQVSSLFSVYLVGLVTTLLAGTVLARLGLRRGMLLAINLCLAGVLLTLLPSLTAVGVGLSVVASGVFIAQTCANSFLRDAAPAGTRVSAAGLYICSYYIGGTVGGVLPGLVWKHGGWPGCVSLTGAVLIVAGLVAFSGWRQSPIDPIPL